MNGSNHYGRLGSLNQPLKYESHHEKTRYSHMRKKGADRQRGNRAADQRLCFRYIDSTISLLPKFEMSSILQYHLLWPYSPVSVENPKDGFCRNAAHSSQHVVLSVSLLFANGI